MENAQNLGVTTGRRLNHVEFAHRPGDSQLVIDLFQALGCQTYQVDTPPFGKYIVVRLDESDHGENDIFVSEAEPEQLAFEDALQRQIETDKGGLGTASAGFRRLQEERPYRTTHIGIRLPSVSTFDDVIQQLETLSNKELSGRLALGDTLSRSVEEARSMSAPIKQIWLWTDVISTGILCVGQQIELQAYDF